MYLGLGGYEVEKKWKLQRGLIRLWALLRRQIKYEEEQK